MNTNYAYEQFVDDFVKAIEQRLASESVHIHRNEMKRVNKTRDSISVRKGDSPMAPVIYLDDKYMLYRSGYSVDEMADIAAKAVRETYATMPPMPVLTRESAKENLYCVVINTKDNEDMLKDVPHEQVEDLSVIAKFRIDDEGSFIVRNRMCGVLKMTPEEVLEQAHINTEEMDFVCRDMCAVLRGCMVDMGREGSVEDQIYNGNRELEGQMYVMTNKRGLEGAAAITSQRAMDQAYLQLGQDFYILPSSRHEVILVPVSEAMPVTDLKDMVREVNESVVEEKDRLSDEVYLYKGDTKTLSLADSPMLSKDKGVAMDHEKICGRKH